MASTYYDSSDKSVIDGDIAYAADLNDINSAVDTALQQVEADITTALSNQSYYSDLAQKWAEEIEDTPVTVGHYSALHWAAKAEDQAILADADRVQTNADRVQTGLDRVATAADRVQTGLDRTQTGLDRVATAADRVQTGLDAAATAQDVIDTQAIVNTFPVLASGDEGKLLQVATPFSNGYNLLVPDFGGGIDWSVSTLDLTTAEGNGYLIDTSSATKIVTLHATPVVGDTIAVGDYAGTFGTHSCTIARNGMLIDGVAADRILNTNNEVTSLVYSGATKGWVTVGSLTGDYPKTVLNKPFMHVQDQKAYNVDGGSSVADAWTKRDLNTLLHNDIQGASLANNEVTLPAGTYYVEGAATFTVANSTQTSVVLSVFKDATLAFQGMTGTAFYPSNNFNLHVNGVVTLASAGVLSLREYQGLALATVGRGKSNSSGSITDASIPSIYADLKIWQLDRSLEIAPVAVNSGLQTVPGLNTEGNVMGFDVTVSGNVLTIGKGSCLDSTLTVPLAFTADKTVTLPTTVNQDFYVFAVRLTNNTTYEPRTYTTLAGPASDAQINAWRLISYAKNDGSGVTMPYMQVAGRIDWLTSARPVLASSLTTSFVGYSVSGILPISIISWMAIVGEGGSVFFTISYDGVSAAQEGHSQISSSDALVIPSMSTIYMKLSANSCAVKVTSITLRR